MFAPCTFSPTKLTLILYYLYLRLALYQFNFVFYPNPPPERNLWHPKNRKCLQRSLLQELRLVPQPLQRLPLHLAPRLRPPLPGQLGAGRGAARAAQQPVEPRRHKGQVHQHVGQVNTRTHTYIENHQHVELGPHLVGPPLSASLRDTHGNLSFPFYRISSSPAWDESTLVECGPPGPTATLPQTQTSHVFPCQGLPSVR